MKKICVILLGLVMGFTITANAQAPYTHSIGVTVGSMNGVSYKTFLLDNLALSVDAGFKWTVVGYGIPMNMEVNPNIMYEAGTGVGGLYWFTGGGLSLGMGVPSVYGKFGLNAIGGIEYVFNIPLTLQVDFRPGYGLAFQKGYAVSYFDWGFCVGLRYTL